MSSTLIFHEVTFRNFKSFGNDLTTVNLNANTLTLIIGRNFDASVNGQIDSNGAGKTTILDAISYCLYDKTISKMSKDDLINNVNKKNMEVTVLFEKDGIFYRIARYRKSKDKVRSGNGIAIYKGDSIDAVGYESIDKNSDIAQAGGADAQIIELMGLPYDIFSRIVTFSASHEPFLSLPSTSTSTKANQKDIIEELVVITEVTEKAKKLNAQISEENKELKTLATVESELAKQKAKFEDQITSLRARITDWDFRKGYNIESLNERIRMLSTVDYSTQEKLLDAIDEIKSTIDDFSQKINLNKVKIKSLGDTLSKSESWETAHKLKGVQLKEQIDGLEDINFDEQVTLIESLEHINIEISDLKTLLQNNSRDSNEAHSKASKAADQIEHLQDNKCPFCLQQFADAKSKLAELEEIKNAAGVIISTTERVFKITTDKIAHLQSKKETISDSLKFTRLDTLHKEKSRRESLQSEMITWSESTNPYASEDLEALQTELTTLESKNSKFSSTIKQLEDELGNYTNKTQFKNKVELEKSKGERVQLEKELESITESTNPHLESLKDMESVTFDQSNADKIKALEKSIAHKTFLHKLLLKPDSFIRKALLTERLIYLNERLRYYLDILGLPHKVEFTAELEAKISEFGNELGHANLSSGQKARVNLALSFAFRDVLQKRYGKINFCLLDECLDVGLSSAGVAQAVQMIKRVAKENSLSMFVITHRDETISSFDTVLEIERRNGFTTVL